jgi:hypothetical protein
MWPENLFQKCTVLLPVWQTASKTFFQTTQKSTGSQAFSWELSLEVYTYIVYRTVNKFFLLTLARLAVIFISQINTVFWICKCQRLLKFAFIFLFEILHTVQSYFLASRHIQMIKRTFLRKIFFATVAVENPHVKRGWPIGSYCKKIFSAIANPWFYLFCYNIFLNF